MDSWFVTWAVIIIVPIVGMFAVLVWEARKQEKRWGE
jgi:heme/copper-type cytochrome/quinol oxidase subunit 2